MKMSSFDPIDSLAFTPLSTSATLIASSDRSLAHRASGCAHTTRTQSAAVDVVDRLVEMSSELAALGAALRGTDEDDTLLFRLTQLAVTYVDGCDWASVTVVRSGRGATLAASDDMAITADCLQYQTGQGPCLSAAENSASYLLFDVDTETRWPSFTAALAAQTPVRSVLSFPLPAQECSALNLFACTSPAYNGDDVNIGAIFAAQASTLVALHHAQGKAVNLERGLDTSREIGAAVGILMARHKITQNAAFSLMRETSQRLHVKLREVAVDVVEAGTVPELPTRRADGIAEQRSLRRAVRQ